MILSDKDIKEYVKKGRIKIKPKPNFEIQLGPSSLDLRLGNKFKVFNHTSKPYIDPKDEKTFKNLTKIVKASRKEPFVLQPNEFVLGATLEEVSIPKDLVARLEGRSSWGRLGVIVHATAGYIDPGFTGNPTLEISNIGMLPVLLYPGARICQLAFEQMTSSAQIPYARKKDSKYFGDQEAQESKIHRDLN